MNDAYAAEREEARATRFSLAEKDRVPRHPHADLGMCGDIDDAITDGRDSLDR